MRHRMRNHLRSLWASSTGLRTFTTVSALWERSRLPEILAQASTSFAAEGVAVLDDVLDERDAHAVLDQVQTLFRSRQESLLPNSTFIFDVSQQKTSLFPKSNILEYDFLGAGKTGFDALDSLHYDTSFSYILDAILKPCRRGSLVGQNVKIQQNKGSGGCFPIHFDSDGAYDARAVTCILYLNASPVQGGELVLYPFGRSRITVEPKFNRMAIFRSNDVAHRVMPCFSQRFCLTIWCSSSGGEQPGDTRDDKERLQKLVTMLRDTQDRNAKDAIREIILGESMVKRLLTKFSLEDEWRQSLLESHAPSPERDVLLQTFEEEMTRIRSFANLIFP